MTLPTIATPGYPSIRPLLVMGYAAASETSTIIHGTIDPAATHEYISLRSAGVRSGTLSLLFGNQDEARTCFDRHRLRLIHTFSHPLRHVMGMKYVVAGGTVEIALDPETAEFWIVSVPYREVI